MKLFGKRNTNLQPVDDLSEAEIAARQAAKDREDRAVSAVQHELKLRGIYGEDTDAALKQFFGGVELDGVDTTLTSYSELVFTAVLEKTFAEAQHAANAAAGGRARVTNDAVIRRFVESKLATDATMGLIWSKVKDGATVIWLPIGRKSRLASIAATLVAHALEDIKAVFAEESATGHRVAFPDKYELRLVGTNDTVQSEDDGTYERPKIFRRKTIVQAPVITEAPADPPGDIVEAELANTGT